MAEGRESDDDGLAQAPKTKQRPIFLLIERGRRGLFWMLENRTVHRCLARGWVAATDQSVVLALAKVVVAASFKKDVEIEIEVRDGKQ